MNDSVKEKEKSRVNTDGEVMVEYLWNEAEEPF